MRSSARSAAIVSLTLLCLAAPLFAQRARRPPAPAPARPAAPAPAVKTPHASVSGRITIKNKPAPGVVVGLRNSELTNQYEPFIRATTGADGIYRIANVAPGNYMVMPAAPGFVAVERKEIVVGEDENIDGINFSLVRGAAITGKVTDADGHPIVLQQVALYRVPPPDAQTPKPPPGQPPPQMYPQMSAMTDDRGIYRAFGLPAGFYKVAVGRGEEEGYGSYSPGSSSYKQVFHPDVSDPAQATVVEVTEAGEAKDVDIKLGPTVQTFSVSGRAINSDSGQPLPNNRFALQRVIGKRTEPMNAMIMTNARGEFVTEGLIAGKYVVTMFANEALELRPDPIAFEIVDQDLTDVTLKFSKGSTVSGVVVFETRNKAALSQINQLLLRAFIPKPAGAGSSASSAIAADGSFHLAGLADGQLNFSLAGSPGPYAPKGFVILRVEKDGVVTQRLQLKDGEQMTGVRVFIGYGTATLRGIVKVENGELPPPARIFVRLTKPGENTSYIRGPQVDERGHFLLEGIPAGDYTLTAFFSYVRNPPTPITRQVTLTDDVITDVTFTIDMKALSTPPPPSQPAQPVQPPQPQ